MIRSFVVAFTCIVITACSSDGEERPEYLDSYSVKALEVPPTLTSPDTSQQLDIPEPSEKAMQMLKQRESTAGGGVVAPEFKGIRLQSDQNMHWLEVDEDADKLWPRLKAFWAQEGIELVRSEPLLAYMETEWIREFQVDKDESVLLTMFKKLSPDRMDKFRMRLVRVADGKSTRIFISHQGLEVFVGDDVSSWRERTSDPDLEYEMLRRLALYAGLGKTKVDAMFTDYIKPFQPRVRPLSGDDEFELIGDVDLVWQRVLHALDELGVKVLGTDRQQGTIDVLVSNVPKKLVKEDDDELNESSWLVRLFTGGPGDEELETGEVTINMTLQPMDNTSRLTLRHAGEALPNIGLAARFEEALVKLLK